MQDEGADLVEDYWRIATILRIKNSEVLEIMMYLHAVRCYLVFDIILIQVMVWHTV